MTIGGVNSNVQINKIYDYIDPHFIYSIFLYDNKQHVNICTKQARNSYFYC